MVVRVKTAAAKLDVSVSQIYNLIGRGELDSVKVGRSIRVPVAAIEKLARGGAAA